MLKGVYLPTHSITQVSLFGEESDTITLDSDTNTDEEGRDENYEEGSKDWINFSINNTPSENNAQSSKKCLLTIDEVDTTEGSFTKNLCGKLARDAYHIANSHASSHN